jgi:hypothetical protein
VNQLRSRIAAALHRLADFLEQRPRLVCLILTVLYLSAAFQASRIKPLWHDELYTLWIASAPTLHDTFALSRAWDLNPPLLYLLTRLSYHLFGVNTLSTRLPEILAFLAALLCLFAFVRRRMGTLFALLAATVLLESDTFLLAVEARPYALMFSSFTLAQLAWQTAATPAPSSAAPPHPLRRPSALILLAAAVLGLLMSHIFAVAILASLLFAELLRARIRRRLDWPVLIALLLPIPSVVVYKPMLAVHGVAIYPAAFQPTLAGIVAFYIESFDHQLLALILTALAILLLLGRRQLHPDSPPSTPRWFFTPSEWSLFACLTTLPLLLMVKLMHSHAAFFPRYGAIITFAVAPITSALLAHFTLNPQPPGSGNPSTPDTTPALIAAVIFLLMSGALKAIPTELAHRTLLPTIANSEPPIPPCQACRIASALNPSLPLVDSSGVTFIEMNYRVPPATLDHIFYLTDSAASASIAHASLFDHMAWLVGDFHFHGHSQPYSDFLLQHPHFFVYGRLHFPEDWLLLKLQQDGASVRFVTSIQDCYRDTELYEVRIPAPTPAPSTVNPHIH